MRIGIEMLGVQSAGRTRGVGRYTRQLVSHLLTRGSPREIVLYFHAGLPGGEDAWPGRPAVRDLAPAGDGGLASAVARLAAENPDRLDALLLTCPLEHFRGYLPPAPRGGRLRLAAIVYDLIPALFPEQYLAHPVIAEAYRRALAAIEQYDLLLPISAAARDDCLRRLRTPADRIVNISAGGDFERFFPRGPAAPSPAAAEVLRKHGLTEPFVYCMTALDHRKNLDGALAAFALLPESLRQTHRLALTCAMSSDDDYARLQQIVAESPAAERIALTGALDDAALRVMYQHCAAFLFPSRCEGFGLPILEALQCGAPVVAGNNSSQIEVVGEAGLLADAESPAEIARQLRRLLEDAELSRRLREAAPAQARRFRWEQSAERCRAALEQVVARPAAAGPLRRWLARGRQAASERLRRYAVKPPVRRSA
ncbi:MAG TPA: glycosyltransferase family 1 protein [Pirellulales bacterium]|nr:glycosyltransferase family 1 protein [Pirellulales bacterium]